MVIQYGCIGNQMENRCYTGQHQMWGLVIFQYLLEYHLRCHQLTSELGQYGTFSDFTKTDCHGF